MATKAEMAAKIAQYEAALKTAPGATPAWIAQNVPAAVAAPATRYVAVVRTIVYDPTNVKHGKEPFAPYKKLEIQTLGKNGLPLTGSFARFPSLNQAQVAVVKAWSGSLL